MSEKCRELGGKQEATSPQGLKIFSLKVGKRRVNIECSKGLAIPGRDQRDNVTEYRGLVLDASAKK